MGNMPKPLEGVYEVLLTHKELFGSGEDHRTLKRMSPFSCKEEVKKINNWLKKQSLLSIEKKKELEMTPALEKEGPVMPTSGRSVQGQAQRTSEETERSQEKSRKGKRKSQLAQTSQKRVQGSQIGTFSCGKSIQYGKKTSETHSQGAGKGEKELSMQIIDEIRFLNSSIDVKLGKFDQKFNKLTSDINDLKKNDRTFWQWHKVTNTQLE
ncbi:hypothetical protein O181_011063 [Austropuccinia psidii MF-1]|uniref:Uncharacterized protein n=1 Tax=Austropuccinia psidii MF-1 TaxID=1389203 RepID=A0A9Q3BU61_9BASI|nr:hypothetical protein [Austropuccinia psidii MF-1]